MFGDEGQHEVQPVVIGQADDDVCIGDAFLFQQVDIRTVAVDSQAIVQEFCRLTAAFAVFIENLDLDALLIEHGRQKLVRRPAPMMMTRSTIFVSLGTKFLLNFSMALGSPMK